MKTIGYGLIQIPVLTRYKVFCIKRTLAGGVKSTGWQEILSCALRILLLSSWGLKSVDYSLPQTADKLIGVYIEFGILSLLFANGVVVLIAMWMKNLHLLYPTLFIIPACFVTDVIVKGTCYAALFLTPKVTSFGVLSLIEVWFRGLSLMYGWIIVISYIHYKKKDWKLTEIDVQLNISSTDLIRNTVGQPSTEAKPHFSRDTSPSRPREAPLFRENARETSDDPGSSLRDGDSEVLLGESATSLLPRFRNRGGFVPEVLRTPAISKKSDCPEHSRDEDHSSQSTFMESVTSGYTIEMPNCGHDGAPLIGRRQRLSPMRKEVPFLVKCDLPPPLPRRPLASGTTTAELSRPTSSTRPSMNWFKKPHFSRTKEKLSEGSSIRLEKTHVPEPVLV